MVNENQDTTQAENELDPELHMEHPILIEYETGPHFTCYRASESGKSRMAFEGIFVKSPALNADGCRIESLPPVMYELEGYVSFHLERIPSTNFLKTKFSWDYLYARVLVKNDDGETSWVKADSAPIKNNQEIMEILCQRCLDTYPVGYLAPEEKDMLLSRVNCKIAG